MERDDELLELLDSIPERDDELWKLLDSIPIVWTRPTELLAWSGDFVQIAQALRNEYDRQAELRNAGGLLPPTSNLLSLAIKCDEALVRARAREAARRTATAPRPGEHGC